jgi:hypothetical protein
MAFWSEGIGSVAPFFSQAAHHDPPSSLDRQRDAA